MPCGGFGERVVNTMAESKNYIVQPQEGGNILISEDVIASIASLAVREVEGVYGLSATQTLDLTAILGKKNLSSGIRVTLQDNVIDIACNLVVRMGQERAGGHRQRCGVHGRRPPGSRQCQRLRRCRAEGGAGLRLCRSAAPAAERQSFTFTLHTKET